MPLSTNVTDEIADSLAASAQGPCSSNIYSIAESEILDYLIAEVYPAFESVRLTLSEQSKGPTAMFSAMKSKLSKRRRSIFANSDHRMMVDIMNKILRDPGYLSLFRGFMVHQGAENLLYGYNELVEIEERLAYISEYNTAIAPEVSADAQAGAKSVETAANVELDVQIFFYYINGFYDAYLTLGAPFRLKCPGSETMVSDFHNCLGCCNSIDLSIFAPVKEATLLCMIENHLERFLSTEDFAGIVRKGRSSIVGLSNSMKKPLAEALLRRESMQKYLNHNSSSVASNAGRGKERDSVSAEQPANTRTSESLATSTSSTIDCDDYAERNKEEVMTRIELKNFIHSEYSACLEKYLQGQSPVAMSLVCFYRVSWAFQQNKFRNKFEQITESCSIFDRYISRNSDEQIGVPDSLRQSVASGLFLNSPFLFKAASDWAFEQVHDSHWKAFKAEVIARAKAELLAAKLDSGDDSRNDESKDSNSGSISSDLGDIDIRELEACEFDISFQDGFAKLANRYFPASAAGSGDTDSPGSNATAVGDASKRRQRSFLAKIFRGQRGSAVAAVAAGAAEGVSPSRSVESPVGIASPSAAMNSDPAKLLASANSNSTSSLPIAETGTTPSASATDPANRRLSFRENCQEQRRRSNNKGIDPARQIAMSQANRSYRRNSVGAVTTIGNDELARRIQQANGDGDGDPDSMGGGDSSPSSLNRRTMHSDQRSVLLRNVLAHPCCCSIFKEFLERMSSSQTILFVVEVEAYRQITNSAFQRISARKIYNKFMHPMCIMPVPVSGETQQKVLRNLEVAGPALFKQAQENVMEYVESCQFPKLLKSPEITLIENILQVEERSAYRDAALGTSRYGDGGVRRRMSSLYFQNVDINESKSLRFVLKNQLCTRFFKEFCNRIFVNESLQFWLDVEYYQGLPSAQYMRRSALKICNKYIAYDANQEINIPYSTKKAILDNIHTPTRDLFKKAKHEIFKLLEQDAMPNFIKGPEYAAMCEALRCSNMNMSKGMLQRVISRFRL